MKFWEDSSPLYRHFSKYPHFSSVNKYQSKYISLCCTALSYIPDSVLFTSRSFYVLGKTRSQAHHLSRLAALATWHSRRRWDPQLSRCQYGHIILSYLLNHTHTHPYPADPLRVSNLHITHFSIPTPIQPIFVPEGGGRAKIWLWGMEIFCEEYEETKDEMKNKMKNEMKNELKNETTKNDRKKNEGKDCVKIFELRWVMTLVNYSAMTHHCLD